jgi:nucleotide-binding universal stress UspA family protein
MIKQILVAVDGSTNAASAIDWTASAAVQLGAAVVAVHALGLLEHDEHAAQIARLEGTWTAPLRDASIQCACAVRDGNPVSVILDVAEELDVDLIVVGSRGLGGYPELLLGSTSTQVAQRSTRPVVIVPDVEVDSPPEM